MHSGRCFRECHRLASFCLALITCLPLRAGAPARLADLFARVDGAKKRSIVQHMSKDLVPISEKGLVDCPLVHR